MKTPGLLWASVALSVCLAACGSEERTTREVTDAGKHPSDASVRDAGPACGVFDAPPGGETVVQGLRLPGAIAVEDEFVYWVEGDWLAQGGNMIGRALKAGGPAELLVEDLDHVLGVAVTSRELIWNEIGSEGNDNGRIAARAKEGGEIRVLADGLRTPLSLAADDRAVFWTAYKRGTTKMELWTREASATEPRLLWSPPDSDEDDGVAGSDLQLTQDAVYLSTWGTPIKDGSPAAPGLLEIARSDGSIVELVAMRSIESIAISPDSVYFVDPAQGLFRIALGGDEAPSMIAMPSAFGLNDLAVDERNVYWLDFNTLSGASLAADDQPAVLTSLEPYPRELAVDGDFIYWTVLGTSDNEPPQPGQPCGMVRRLPAP